MPKGLFTGKDARGRPLAVLVAGLAVIVAALAVYVEQPRLLRALDHKVYDMLLPLRKLERTSGVPVIVDIDEESLARYGQWPWPRHLVADLLDRLTASGVAAIGLDIMFAEEDRASPRRLREHIRRDRGAVPSLQVLPGELPDYDALLARSLAEAPAVLGMYARFRAGDETRELPDSVGIISRDKPGAPPFTERLMTAGDAVLPLPVLRQQAPVGFINAAPGEDGVIRRVSLLIRVRDKVYPSLALRALMRALGTETLVVFSGPDGLEGVRVGDYTIPVTPEGFILVPFQGGAKTYPYISAKDVLSGSAAPDALRNTVVFVGTSAPGLVDLRTTPFARLLPGVEVHASVLDAILMHNIITPPPWAPGAQVSAIVLFGIAAAGVFGFSRARIYIPAALLLLALVMGLSVHLFKEGVFLSPMYVMLTVTVQGIMVLFMRFIQEERQKVLLRSAFSRYVSPEVVRRITRQRDDLFAGEEREVSILFTDIRGFTSISETLSPQQVVALLNRYFTPMTALVRQREGTLDKFIGDALMAFWNAPLDVPDHAERAVSAALAMRESLVSLNEELRAEFGVDIRIGAGIHTGSVYVGNMGSNDLINYTLIGDNVNLASRLEGLCVQYGVDAVVSESAMSRCNNAFAFQHVDTVRVRGRQLPVAVYHPLLHEEYERRLEEMRGWEAALEHYRQGRFKAAAESFAALRRAFPSVRLYELFSRRADTLTAAPPAAWDGIWNLSEK